jgi:thiamine biosynthesis lipoprotein
MIPFALSPIGADVALDTDPQQASATSRRVWQFHDEYVLGTSLDVLVNTPSAELAAEAARVARDEIDRLDRIFNSRRTDSEVSALNQARRAQVSPELFAVVRASEVWRAITRGAFDARLGELFRSWSREIAPDRETIARMLESLRASTVSLDPAALRIELSHRATLAFDALAKGYIVDAALNAARRAMPAIEGLAISIGGDVRCWGVGAKGRGWRVGIPDTRIPALNAPLVDSLVLRNAAIATSGRGPRDCVGNRIRSSTISPFDGQPVHEIVSASAVASHAMDADAIATACMVLSPKESLALADRLEGVHVRITDTHGQVFTSSTWPTLMLAATSPEQHIAQNDQRNKKSSSSTNPMWPAEWVLSIDYTAPPRQAKRSADFRSPYMAMWITDEKNRPVRTVLMVGRELDWQRDNFVWFGINRPRSKELVELRSLPTSVSGRYPVYWAGMDDDGKPVPVGKYTLHLETSQERGKHNYRNVTLELRRSGFRQELPKLEGSGGIEIFYGHPSERYNYR